MGGLGGVGLFRGFGMDLQNAERREAVGLQQGQYFRLGLSGENIRPHSTRRKQAGGMRHKVGIGQAIGMASQLSQFVRIFQAVLEIGRIADNEAKKRRRIGCRICGICHWAERLQRRLYRRKAFGPRTMRKVVLCLLHRRRLNIQRCDTSLGKPLRQHQRH